MAIWTAVKTARVMAIARRQGAAEEDTEGEDEGGIADGDDTARAEHHRVDPREEGVRGVGSAADDGLVDRAAPPGHREAGLSGDGQVILLAPYSAVWQPLTAGSLRQRARPVLRS
jgi:hypothetical protein